MYYKYLISIISFSSFILLLLLALPSSLLFFLLLLLHNHLVFYFNFFSFLFILKSSCLSLSTVYLFLLYLVFSYLASPSPLPFCYLQSSEQLYFKCSFTVYILGLTLQLTRLFHRQIGLAVGDIDTIRKTAALERYTSQVDKQ